MLEEPRFDPWAALGGEPQLFVRRSLLVADAGWQQMRPKWWQVALVGDGNKPPGAARRSELAKTSSSAGSRVVGASGAVVAGTRGSSSASATSGGK